MRVPQGRIQEQVLRIAAGMSGAHRDEVIAIAIASIPAPEGCEPFEKQMRRAFGRHWIGAVERDTRRFRVRRALRQLVRRSLLAEVGAHLFVEPALAEARQLVGRLENFGFYGITRFTARHAYRYKFGGLDRPGVLRALAILASMGALRFVVERTRGRPRQVYVVKRERLAAALRLPACVTAVEDVERLTATHFAALTQADPLRATLEKARQRARGNFVS